MHEPKAVVPLQDCRPRRQGRPQSSTRHRRANVVITEPTSKHGAGDYRIENSDFAPNRRDSLYLEGASLVFTASCFCTDLGARVVGRSVRLPVPRRGCRPAPALAAPALRDSLRSSPSLRFQPPWSCGTSYAFSRNPQFDSGSLRPGAMR
jgi:hypothetical protein